MADVVVVTWNECVTTKKTCSCYRQKQEVGHWTKMLLLSVNCFGDSAEEGVVRLRDEFGRKLAPPVDPSPVHMCYVL